MVLVTTGQNTDSLVAQLNTVEGKERIELLHELIPGLWLNYPSQALQYGEESLIIAKQLNDSVNISKSIRLIAGVYYYWGEYDTSLIYNQRALEIALNISDSTLINNCYNNIGLLYYNLGNYQSALEYLLQSLRIKELTGETYGKSSTLNNIGQIYEKNKEYETARDYYLQALSIARETEDIDQQIYSNNNIGKTYIMEDHPETSRVYFEKGLELAKINNNINWGSISLRGLAEIALAQDNLKKAESLVRESLQRTREIDDRKGISEGYYVLSKTLLNQKRYKEAITALDSSHAYAIKLESRQQVLDNLQLYIAIHKKRNDLANTTSFQSQYIELRDSLFLETTKRNLELVPIKLKEASDRIQLSGQQVEIEQRKLINRVYVIILLISIPVIALLILLLSKIRSSNIKLRINNREILSQKLEIEKQKEEIQEQNKKLTQSIKQLQRTQSMLTESEKLAAIGQLVGGLAHELNNPLNFIGGIIRPMKMNLEDLKAYSKEIEKSESYQEMHTLVQGVVEGTNRASLIIDKLKAISPKLRTQEKEEFDLSDCIDETITQIEEEYGAEHMINNLVQQRIMIRSNYYEVSKIISNILNNAIIAVGNNHPNNRKIYLEVLDLGNKVQLIIQDNGIGIKKDIRNKIFDPFFTTYGDQGASGLGLFVTRTLVERNKGTIKVDSEELAGSTFTVTLPRS
jgi:signal transduction histidine kinase